MKAIGIIPARMAASRFPGKPLAQMLGMPMIGHCYHRTRLAPGLAAAYVATCDEPIADYVRGIGGHAVMTASTHNRATTRTAEALEIIERETGERIDIVVMVQGDEPLISPDTIGETLRHFADPTVSIVNVMSRLRTLEAFVDKNNVKVVADRKGDALYFSREPIPSPWKGWEQLPRYMQTGIIAFRRDALLQFNAMAETPLEQFESVDMNRVLENGGAIRMVLTEAFTIGVDTPEELADAERHLRSDPAVRHYLAP
ncbi:MAG: 3-deoxy-manno-octulosonate cytidylyltransferase [Ignavibacteria bacterium]